MIEYIFSLVIIVFTYTVYKCYIKPKRTQAWYKRTIEGLGYKVLEYSFKPLKVSIVEENKICEKKYGDALWNEKHLLKDYDVLLYNIFNETTVAFVNPQLISEVFLPDKIKVFPKNNLIINSIKTMLGKGILFSENQEWREKRKLLSHVFNFDFLKSCIPKICQICDNMLSSMELREDSKKQGKFSNEYQFDSLQIGAKIFSNVIMMCFFNSYELKEQIEGMSSQMFLLKTFEDCNKISLHPLIILFGTLPYKIGLTHEFRQLKRRIGIYTKLATSRITQRLTEIKEVGARQNYEDIIQAIVYFNQQKQEKSQINIDDLVQEFSTFLIAGTDTTAHLLMMMIYLVSLHPRVEERLKKEINEVIRSNEDYTYENIKKLTYLEWVQNETTRYYGPSTKMFERNATEDHFIKDIPIKKGTNINIKLLGNHHNPKYFKDPQEFRPERWEKQCDNLEPCVFVGFGGGPRNCLGKHLALLESKIALIKILKRYNKIELPEDKRKNIAMTHNFFYAPLPFMAKYIKESDQKFAQINKLVE